MKVKQRKFSGSVLRITRKLNISWRYIKASQTGKLTLLDSIRDVSLSIPLACMSNISERGVNLQANPEYYFCLSCEQVAT